MSALVAACPSFAGAWVRHREEWSGASESHAYIDAGRFAQHLVEQHERGETDEFPAVFRAIESLLEDEDPGVRYLVKVGLLEDLGNHGSNRRDWTWAARFREWFGPLTTQAWDDLHLLWGTSDGG